MSTTLLVNIDVDDLHKGTDFYTKAFGLAVGRRFGADAVELLGATSPIYLLAKPNGTVASATSRHLRSYARHWTPCTWISSSTKSTAPSIGHATPARGSKDRSRPTTGARSPCSPIRSVTASA